MKITRCGEFSLCAEIWNTNRFHVVRRGQTILWAWAARIYPLGSDARLLWDNLIYERRPNDPIVPHILMALFPDHHQQVVIEAARHRLEEVAVACGGTSDGE